MCADLDNSTAFRAALSLVLKGLVQPSGYTEPLLHKYRYRLKHDRDLSSIVSLCRSTKEAVVEI